MKTLINIAGFMMMIFLIVSFIYAVVDEIPLILKILWGIFGVIGVAYTLGSGILWK